MSTENVSQIFYVKQDLHDRYEIALPVWWRYVDKKLAEKGIDNVIFHGLALVGTENEIDTSVMVGRLSYNRLHERLIKKIEEMEVEGFKEQEWRELLRSGYQKDEVFIGDYKLVLTCGAMPEQYDVFKDDKQVGYLRLRHGYFVAYYSELPVYDAEPEGDGIFADDERTYYLTKAIEAIERKLNERNTNKNRN